MSANPPAPLRNGQSSLPVRIKRHASNRTEPKISRGSFTGDLWQFDQFNPRPVQNRWRSTPTLVSHQWRQKKIDPICRVPLERAGGSQSLFSGSMVLQRSEQQAANELVQIFRCRCRVRARARARTRVRRRRRCCYCGCCGSVVILPYCANTESRVNTKSGFCCEPVAHFRYYGLRSATAYILVFDVNLPETFQYVKNMREQILQSRAKEVPILVVGNKHDLGELVSGSKRQRNSPTLLSPSPSLS